MENKDLHSFIENRLGEKLTKKNKRQLEKLKKASAKYDMQKVNEQIAITPKWNKQKKIIFRYGATAIASIILSLSIVLPITLGNTKTIYVPEYIYVDGSQTTPPSNDKNFTDIGRIDTSYNSLNALGGLLLFVEEEQVYDGDYFIEIDEDDLTELSYMLADGIVLVNNEDTFLINYRVRLHDNYTFVRYYGDNFATLVDIYKKNSSLITGEDVSLTYHNVTKIEEPEKTVEVLMKLKVDAFLIDDIVVVCSIKDGFGFIYFVYGDNEYFIKIEVDSCNASFDATYIKEVFMAELFGNIKNNTL